jgi:hypothetical protein
MTQRVLVTAGASGVGLAIAKTFAADGARVHIADINEQAVKEVTEANGRITGSVADISNPQAVKHLLKEVKKKLGGLDVLVNNAGISGQHGITCNTIHSGAGRRPSHHGRLRGACQGLRPHGARRDREHPEQPVDQEIHRSSPYRGTGEVPRRQTCSHHIGSRFSH